jgi:hypothetical protein
LPDVIRHTIFSAHALSEAHALQLVEPGDVWYL